VEADFINVYIARQKHWIEDLLAKNIMLEAKLQLSESRLADKAKEVDQITVQLEDKSNHINKLAQTNNDKQRQISDLTNLLEDTKRSQLVDQQNKTQKKKKTEQSVAADEF
jgi:hypothetical protein